LTTISPQRTLDAFRDKIAGTVPDTLEQSRRACLAAFDHRFRYTARMDEKPRQQSFWKHWPTQGEFAAIVGLLLALVLPVGGIIWFAHAYG
jgi:hypothetical protein